MDEKHDKTVEIKKEAESFTVGQISINYHYRNDLGSKIDLCFQDARYRQLTKFECESMDIAKARLTLTQLAQGPQKIEELKKSKSIEQSL